MHSIARTNYLTCPSNRPRPRYSLAPTTSINTKSIRRVRKEDLSRPRMSPVTHLENSGSSNLRFNRLQPSNDDLVQHKTLKFGNFVAREAILDEELWTAAYLRAECHWENRTDERKIHHLAILKMLAMDLIRIRELRVYVKNCKVDFATRVRDVETLEFNALKERSKGKLGKTNKCVVAVMKDRNVKSTVIRSVVGTLDFSIRHLLHGESFPGAERNKYRFPSINTKHPEKYVYVSNLCLRLSARRQSIASNMLRFVIESTKLSGIASIYVHVHRNNEPAIELYRKINFQVVEKANSHLLENQMCLLCYRA